MNRIAGRAWISLILALSLVAGYIFFFAEYMTKADTWVVHVNSPHVYNRESETVSISCGVVIGRDNKLLVDLRDGRKYSGSETLRKSTIHWLGDHYGRISAPAISYYVEQIANYDPVSGLYNYGDTSATVELTLSATVQQAALEALGDYKGTIAVINYETGETLCSVSTPTYDPDNVPEDLPKLDDTDYTGPYEGVYVNRFTQGLYIPGSIFKVVTLAAALENIADIQQRSFYCNGSLEIEGEKITCESAHGTQSLKNAFCNSCNCAFGQIALELGGETLEKYAKKFGITEQISFDGITTAAGNFQSAGAADLNVAWSGVGQYKDQINPCAFLTFVSAIARDGQGVNPYLVERISVGKTETYQADPQEREEIISETTAEIIREYMRYNVQALYGDDNFPGMTVCAKTGTAQVGGGKRPNAMLTGFALDPEYPVSFIICVEDAGYGSRVCIPMATKVLAACKEAMDN